MRGRPDIAPISDATHRVLEPHRYTAEEVRAIRRGLGVSQDLFGQLLGVTKEAVRVWEQQGKRPGLTACRTLDLLQDHREWFMDHLIERKERSDGKED